MTNEVKPYQTPAQQIEGHEKVQMLLRADTEALKIAKDVLHACSETKARDLTILNVEQVFSLSSLFIIASGRSDRQVQGICNRIRMSLEEHGLTPISIDGYEQGHWILMDYGDVVVHVFYEPVREHYGLESLWSGAQRYAIPDDIIDDVDLRAA